MAINNIASVTKVMTDALDKAFALDSLTENMVGDNSVQVSFVGAKTVRVTRLATTNLKKYKRGGSGATNERGAVESTQEEFTLKQERYSEIPVDELDNLDDAGIVLGHLQGEFYRSKVVPEIDAFRFSKLASFTNTIFGNRVEEEIAPDKIIEKLNDAFLYLSEHKVPERNQVIFVNPKVMKLLRSTKELTRFLNVDDGKNQVTFTIYSYEGRKIVEVPSDEFYTDIELDDGYYPTAKSKVINFLVVNKTCPIFVKRLQKAHIFDSTDEKNGSYIGFEGYLATNLIYHDAFVPDNKRAGIYASVSTTSATGIGSGLDVSVIAGGHGNSKLTYAQTQPAGMYYDKLYLAKQASVAIGANTRSFTEITPNVDFTPDPTNNIFVASLDNKAIAVSKNFKDTLPKGQ